MKFNTMKTTYRLTLPDGTTRFRKHRPSSRYPITFAVGWYDHKRGKWDGCVYPAFQSADKILASYDPSQIARLVKFEVVEI